MKKRSKILIISMAIVLTLFILAAIGWYSYPLIVSKEFIKASNATNVNDCEKMIIPAFKDFCFNRVAYSRQDTTICGKATNKFYGKDECYGKLGAIKKDLSICDMVEINHNKEKDFCYEKVAAARNDPSICEQIESRTIKDACYEVMGVIRKDFSICERITAYDETSGQQLYHCLVAVAAANKDSAICDRINDQHDKKWCYDSVSAGKENKEICDMLDEGVIREDCYRANDVVE